MLGGTRAGGGNSVNWPFPSCTLPFIGFFMPMQPSSASHSCKAGNKSAAGQNSLPQSSYSWIYLHQGGRWDFLHHLPGFGKIQIPGGSADFQDPPVQGIVCVSGRGRPRCHRHQVLVQKSYRSVGVKHVPFLNHPGLIENGCDVPVGILIHVKPARRTTARSTHPHIPGSRRTG